MEIVKPCPYCGKTNSYNVDLEVEFFKRFKLVGCQTCGYKFSIKLKGN